MRARRHHVATAVTYGRTGAGDRTPVKTKRRRGARLSIIRTVTVASGRQWLVTRFGTYYDAEQCAPGRYTRTGTRARSARRIV